MDSQDIKIAKSESEMAELKARAEQLQDIKIAKLESEIVELKAEVDQLIQRLKGLSRDLPKEYVSYSLYSHI
jgi:cell division protein FtsB